MRKSSSPKKWGNRKVSGMGISLSIRLTTVKRVPPPLKAAPVKNSKFFFDMLACLSPDVIGSLIMSHLPSLNTTVRFCLMSSV